MIYITNLIKVTDTKHIPIVENYDPFNSKTGYDEPREELEKRGYFIDKTLQDVLNMEYQFIQNNPSPYANYEVKRYYNPQINDFTFEYEEVKNPIEDALKEQIEALQADKQQLQLTIAELVEKQENDKQQLQLAIAEIIEGMGV